MNFGDVLSGIAGGVNQGADIYAKQQADDTERKAELANTMIKMGDRAAAVGIIKELHPETASQDFSGWIAEGEQEKAQKQNAGVLDMARNVQGGLVDKNTGFQMLKAGGYKPQLTQDTMTPDTTVNLAPQASSPLLGSGANNLSTLTSTLGSNSQPKMRDAFNLSGGITDLSLNAKPLTGVETVQKGELIKGGAEINPFDGIKPKVEWKSANGGETMVGYDPNGNIVQTKQIPYQINPMQQLRYEIQQQMTQDRIENAWKIAQLNNGTRIQIADSRDAGGGGYAPSYQFLQTTDNNGNPVYSVGNARTGQITPGNVKAVPKVGSQPKALSDAEYIRLSNQIDSFNGPKDEKARASAHVKLDQLYNASRPTDPNDPVAAWVAKKLKGRNQ